jgi:hypothetical protein
LLAFIAVGAIALVVLTTRDRNSTPAPPVAATTNATPAVTQPTHPPKPALNFSPLLGRWVRPDGGYVLLLKNVGAEGQLEAEYLNPASIHVATAAASGSGSTLNVFVELRDINYPGSTYTLTYDSAADALVGTYYQATAQHHFQVVFTRSRP